MKTKRPFSYLIILLSLFGILDDSLAQDDQTNPYWCTNLYNNYLIDEYDRNYSDAWHRKIITDTRSSLMDGTSKNPSIDLLNHIQSLEKTKTMDDFDFEGIKNEILQQFPTSSEHRFAIGLAYFEIPSHYINPDKKDKSQGMSHEEAILGYRYKCIMGMRYLYEAFNMSIKEDNKKRASLYAFVLAKKIINTNHDIYENLNSLTDLTTNPKNKISPVAHKKSYIFTPFSTPDSWDNAKNDGERVMWLLHTSKELAPDLATHSCNLLWGNFILPMFHSSKRTLGMQIEDTPITQCLSQLKANEYIYEPDQNETTNSRKSLIRITTLTGIYDYIHSCQMALKDNPSNVEAALILANTLWSRSKYKEAVQVLQSTAQHSDKCSKKEKEQLFSILKALTNPTIIPQTDHEFSKIIFQIPKEGIKIPVLYHTKPLPNWEVIKINYAELTRNQMQQLSRIQNTIDFNKKNKEFIPHNLYESILANEPWLSAYLKKTSIVHSDLLITEPYRRYTGHVHIPINEPGLYLVTNEKAPNDYPLFIQIEPFSYMLSEVLSGYECIVFDSQTGKPISKAQGTFTFWYLNDRDSIETKTMDLTSDKNGIFHLAGLFPPRSTQNDCTPSVYMGALIMHNQHTLSISPRQLDHHIYNKALKSSDEKKLLVDNSVSAFCLLNQPIYQPGDEVHGKFVLARYQLNSPNAGSFAGQPIKMIVNTQQGKEISLPNVQYVIDDFGSINFSFTLPKNTPLGQYSISFLYPDTNDDEKKHTHLFQVEQFVKPDIYANADIVYDFTPPKKSINIEIDAQYYAGGPIKKGMVEYNLFSVSKNYASTSLDQWWEKPHISYKSNYNPISILQTGLLILNEEGKSSFTYDLTNYDFERNTEYSKEKNYHLLATITEESGKTITFQKRFPLFQYPFNVILDTNLQFFQQDKAYEIQWRAMTKEGKPAPYVKGSIKLVKKSSIDSQSTNNQIEEIISTCKVECNEQGIANWLWTPKVAGEYELRSTWTNQAGEIFESIDTILIVGKNIQTPFTQDLILTDKKSYLPNEQVRLLILSKNPENYVFLKIKSTCTNQISRITKTTSGYSLLSFATDENDRPNFSIEAHYLGGHNKKTLTCEVLIPPTDVQLDLIISPNKTKYEPNSSGSVKIQAKLPSGKPAINCQLTLTIFDASLEYFSEYPNNSLLANTWGKFNTFHNSQIDCLKLWHDTPSYNLINQALLPSYSYAICGTYAQGYTGDSNGYFDNNPHNRQRENNIRQSLYLRKNFKNNIKWEGSILTDNNGEAIIPIQIPDNTTTWKILAWGRTSDLKIGQAEASFVSSKDLVMNNHVPRFMVKGDRSSASVIIRNTTKEPINVQTTLESENSCISLLSSKNQNIIIPANGQKLISWELYAATEGKGQINIKATSEQYNDFVGISIPILTNRTKIGHLKSTILYPQQKDDTIEINIPKKKKDEEIFIKIQASTSLALTMVDALPYLIKYPYESSEQTAARIGPFFLVAHTLNTLGHDVQSWLHYTLPEYANQDHKIKKNKTGQYNLLDIKELRLIEKTAMEQLKKLQNPDGGWSWYTSNTDSNLLSTLFTMESLSYINEHAQVDEMLTKAQSYLQKEVVKSVLTLNQCEKEINPANPYKNNNTEAILYKSLKNKQTKEAIELERHLWLNRSQLELLSLLYLAQAYAQEGEQTKLRHLKTLINQYIKQDRRSQQTWLHEPNVQTFNWNNDKILIQAEYLYLLTQTAVTGSREEKIMVQVAKWLTQNRSYGNQFTISQEHHRKNLAKLMNDSDAYWQPPRVTQRVLNALCTYCLRTKESNEPTILEIWMNNKLQKTISLSKETLFAHHFTIKLDSNNSQSGKNLLRIKRKKGKSNIYASAQWEYCSLEERIPAAGNQATIERNYYRLTNLGPHTASKMTPLKWGDQVNKGDIIEVNLIVRTKNDMPFTLIKDPVPSGFINTKSASEKDALSHAYCEIALEETRWLYEILPQGEHQIKYHIQAQQAGKFKALPAVIEAMYAPQLRGNSCENQINVRKE